MNLLFFFFPPQEEPKNISEKCEGNTFQKIPFYYFMCLTARASHNNIEGITLTTDSGVKQLAEKQKSVHEFWL